MIQEVKLYIKNILNTLELKVKNQNETRHKHNINTTLQRKSRQDVSKEVSKEHIHQTKRVLQNDALNTKSQWSCANHMRYVSHYLTYRNLTYT